MEYGIERIRFLLPSDHSFLNGRKKFIQNIPFKLDRKTYKICFAAISEYNFDYHLPSLMLLPTEQLPPFVEIPPYVLVCLYQILDISLHMFIDLF